MILSAWLRNVGLDLAGRKMCTLMARGIPEGRVLLETFLHSNYRHEAQGLRVS